MRSEWNFETVKSASAMGTFRSMASDFGMPPEMIPDDDNDDVSDYGQDSMDTSGATNGSPGPSIGMNAQAAHSTVIIKPLAPMEKSVQAILEERSTTEDTGIPSAHH